MTEVTASEIYRYTFSAFDLDADPLTFDLSLAPDGMTINSTTRTIVWEPTLEHVGDQQVVLRAQDGRGGVDTQRFTIQVAAPNRHPQFLSSPVGTISLTGGVYTYQAQTLDADGDEVTYSLPTAPTGATIDPVTGLLTWTPPTLGPADFVVQVDDGQGGITQQSFTVDVVSNAPPVFDPQQPLEPALVDQPWSFTPAVTDPEGDSITLSIDPAAAALGITVHGDTLNWTPNASHLGTVSIELTATDPGGSFSTINLTLPVASLFETNDPPTITSTPSGQAIVGQLFEYQAQATDPENDPLLWLLDNGPDGATIDSSTGLFTWTPTLADTVAPAEIAIRVVDPLGNGSTQLFTLTVGQANTPPLITSTPTTVGVINQTYSYAVATQDPEGQPVTITAEAVDPASNTITLSVDAGGVLTFTPDQIGTYLITVTATDSTGGSGAGIEQVYGLAVQATATNAPPQILSQPVFHAVADQPYEYQVSATDPENATLTYAITEGPTGLTVDPSTGLITWTPTPADLGTTSVTVSVTDGQLTASQRYSLNVTANNAPQLQLVTDKTVVAGTLLTLQANASDVDGDALIFSLANAPAGMAIDTNGLITWTPTPTDVAADPYVVAVTATDPYGLAASQDVNITVAADQAPRVQVLAGQQPALLGEPVTFLVDGVDDLGLTSLQLTINGQPVAINIDRTATFTPSNLTDLTVVATATDTAGQTATDSLTLTVVDPTDLAAPVVEILAPGDGTVLEMPTDVLVTIDDPDPGSTSIDYTLELRAAEDDDFRIIASGSGEITNTAIAQLDPTLLANGVYTLRLTAADGSGNTTIATQTFTVDTRLKLGNFGLRFTDLTIPLAGIPIAVERVYDTLNALPGSTVEDFGQGWSLSVLDFKLQTDVNVDGLGIFNEAGIAPPLKNGTRITIKLPDGSTAAFRARPEPVDPITSSVFAQYGGVSLVKVVFVPETGTSLANANQTLRLTDQPTLVLADDGSFQTSLLGTPFNPASAGIDYVLESQDGTAFRIDSVTGQLRDITDRDGNQIVVAQSGITAVNPQGQVVEQINFTRDSQGRITKVVDPSGDAITYGYSATGNLASVTNRADETVTLHYNTPATFNQPHYLTSITDTRNVDVLTVNYDPATGRLLGLTDASGATAGFSYELGIPELGPDAFAEVIADADGVPTELIRDARGNVIRRMAQLDDIADAWQVEVFEYDDRDNQTAVLEPFQAIGRDRFTDAPIVQQSARSFDDRGNVLAETDALGNTTTFQYDGFGNPTAIVDPLGNTTTNDYDSLGRLSKTTDALGNVTRFGYDTNGNLTQVVQVDDLGLDIIQSQFNFDVKGQLLDSTDVSGLVRFFRYDEDGNQTLSYRHWEDPADTDTTVDKTLVSRTDYDEEGRVLATHQYTLTGQRAFNTASELDVETSDWSTSTTYDSDGRVLTSTDRFGNVSTNRYDARGNTVETRNESEDENGLPVTVVTRTAYDANGRVIASTDPFVEGTTSLADIRVTHSIYDDLGRTVETRRVAGVDISLIDLGTGLFKTTFDEAYAPTAILSASSTTYDDVAGNGRVLSTTTPDGLTTYFEYDLAGRQTAVTQGVDLNQDDTTDAIDTDLDTIPDAGSELIVTRFEYDAAGRQTKVTDPLGRITETQYDALGRVVKTIRRGDTSGGSGGDVVTETIYDALGRRSAAIDPMGQRTDFGYDNAGRLTTVTLPGVLDADPSSPTFNQTVRPAYTYGYDVYGNQTSITDPKGRVTAFTFDEQNRQASRTLPLGVETTADPTDFTETSEYFTPGSPGSGPFVGLLKRTTDFEGRTTDFTYDSFGRLKTKTHTDPATSATRTVTYTYDALGRTVTIDDSGHGITTHQYDAESRLTARTTPEGTIRYEYDNLGRMTRTYTGSPDTGHNSIASDAKAVTDTRYTYDQLGRLKTVTAVERFDQPLPTPELTHYRYDHVGNLNLTFLPNGVVTDYVYDTFNRLVDQIHYSPDATPEDLTDNAVLTRFQYTVRRRLQPYSSRHRDQRPRPDHDHHLGLRRPLAPHPRDLFRVRR